MFRRRSMTHVGPGYQPVLRQVGLDGHAVFEHPDIRVWRSIPDRQNCVLDATLADGRAIRLHIKRYDPVWSWQTPADVEARGIQLLIERGIPTAPLVAWGNLEDGRSFVILEDLAGYQPCDKLLEQGLPFARLLEATADLAAKLHNASLHHRDLYLCHFFGQEQAGRINLKLIDAARVRPLPRLFTGRWIVKDLAQFWYSTLRQPVSDEQRLAWLSRYVSQAHQGDIEALRRAIERKMTWMARHDAALNRKQPKRNVSIDP